MGRGGDSNVHCARAPSRRQIALEEVAKHNKPSDGWVVIRDKVYDISQYQHPGGNVMYSHTGLDATDVFSAFHPPNAYRELERLCVGELDSDSAVVRAQQRQHTKGGGSGKEESTQGEIEKDFRALRAAAKRMGLYKASPLYYTWKVVSTLAFQAAAVAALIHSTSWPSVILATFLTAMFWQQSGWLSHDFLHHQVFSNRFAGDLMGIFLGNVCQGFSVEWWKNKHNTHHAIPNLHETTKGRHDGDPDIDTMPMLAWSSKLAREYMADSAAARFFVAHQQVLYFPLLLMARFSWVAQSFFFAFCEDKGAWGDFNSTEGLPPKRVRHRGLEKAGLLLHYAWILAIVLLFLSPAQAAFYLAGTQMLCGIFLAIPFGVGHNGMAVYDAGTQPDFYRLQITTTRNVHGSPFVHWFMGGLSYQVEHHLYPQMPRNNLPAMAAMVRRVCDKHGIPYKSTSLWEGTVEVLSALKDISQEAFHKFPAM